MKDCVNLILNWYISNRRDLPWRKDKNPYHVWISEIMLQQTRIEAVIDCYHRFLKKLPTISDLATISEDELLKLWEGLGYYSRARNLKKAAVKIMNEYHGVFPSDYSSIIQLPGIGEYTAGAISSICFNQKEVAIDGNVMRVYCRVLNLDLDVSDLKVKKEIAKEIKKILPTNSGDFNQGIMELGETICIPGGVPKCNDCPLKKKCLAHRMGREALIPQKIKKSKLPEEEYTVFIIQCGEHFALHKRGAGLLQNMWEFPNQEGFISSKNISFPKVLSIEKDVSSNHTFSHKKWILKSYYIVVEEEFGDYTWASIDEIDSSYAIPTAFFPFYTSIKKRQ